MIEHIDITGVRYTPDEPIKKYVTKKIGKLDRFLPRHARKTLIAHAEGRVQHIHAGSCPSELDGHDKRDDECPVCQALMALEAN